MVKHFTRENLGWPSMNSYPECSFKESDTRLILGFLISEMEKDSAALDEISLHAFIAAKGDRRLSA